MTTAPAITPGLPVAKKKGEPKVPLYVKIPKSLRDRFEKVASDNDRKLNAEVVRALEAYCRQHEEAQESEEDD